MAEELAEGSGMKRYASRAVSIGIIVMLSRPPPKEVRQAQQKMATAREISEER